MTLEKINPLSPQSVLICEDLAFCRLGIELSLRQSLGQIQNLQKTASGREAIQIARNFRLDLLLLDLHLPDISGLEVIESIRSFDKNLPILVITSSQSPLDVRRAVQMGASGILSKSASADRLGEMIPRLLHPEKRDMPLLDPHARLLLEVEANQALTLREYDVLERVAKGWSNRKIAEDLGCALTTVRFHRANLMEKIQVRNAAELTAAFLQGKIQKPNQ